MKALVIDLGRSQVRFGLVDGDVPRLQRLEARDLPEPGFVRLLESLADECELDLSSMTIGVAAPGPFSGGQFMALNMKGWGFEIGDLRKLTPNPIVVHDVIGGALGVVAQESQKDGAKRRRKGAKRSPRTFIQTGVGLGVAALLPVKEDDWLPISGEGGSAMIPPISDDEKEVYEFFEGAPGEWDFHTAQALLSHNSLARYAEPLGGNFGSSKAPEIVKLAKEGYRPARRALDVYAGFLGTFAADVALMFRSYEGVAIAGYLPNELDPTAQSVFAERFKTRGLVSNQLRGIPIQFVDDQFNTLRGLTSLLAKLERGA